MDCKNVSSKSDRKSPRGSKRRSESKGTEQDAGLLITVAGNSEDRSVAEKTEKNIELLGQRLSRNTESIRRSSKDGKEKSANKSRSFQRLEEASKREDLDYHRSKSHKHRSRSRSRERKRRSRSRDRRERTRSRDRRDRSRSRDRRERSRSRDRWERSRSRDRRERSRSRDRRERSRSRDRRERSRSRDRRERSRSRERYDGYRSGEKTRRSRERKDRSRSIEFKLRERRDRSRSKERKDRSRSRDRRKSRRDRSMSVEQRRERSRSADGRRSRSLERTSKKTKSEKMIEKRRDRDSKSSRSPYRRESEDRSYPKEEKLDLFSSGIKRLHDGKGRKAKKIKTTLTEPIVILSDDEQDPTPKRKSEKRYLEDKISNRIEPIITPRSSASHRSNVVSVVEEPPLPTEELSLPPMPPVISNVKVLTDAREPNKDKRHLKEVLIEENIEKEENRTKQTLERDDFDLNDEELAYDPEFPTVDMEESPIESPSDVEEAAEPIHLHVSPLLHKDFSMQRISPLSGPPPPPMPGQGLLGEPSILLPSSLGEPPQPLLQGAGQQMPLQLRMIPPGFHGQQGGGLPPQRQLIVNHPMFINRPGSFPHLQQLPAGHPLQPRLVSTPAGMVTVQNQFSPRIPSLVSLSGQPGLINGALDHLSHDPPLILTTDPRGDPRLHHPPHAESHVISIRPEVPVVPITVSESIPLSVSSSEALSMNQSDIIPSASQLEQISQITKLLNTQAQLAMLGKEPKGLDHASQKQEPMERKNTNSVFKVPLPPILTHTINKVKSEKENMEMVDMDMSSPQDNGNIEIPTSSSEKSERSRRRDKKKSRRHRSGDRHRSSHEDRVSSTVEPQRTFDQMMEEMNNADEIPSSAVELTNKEKVWNMLLVYTDKMCFILEKCY